MFRLSELLSTDCCVTEWPCSPVFTSSAAEAGELEGRVVGGVAVGGAPVAPLAEVVPKASGVERAVTEDEVPVAPLPEEVPEPSGVERAVAEAVGRVAEPPTASPFSTTSARKLKPSPKPAKK